MVINWFELYEELLVIELEGGIAPRKKLIVDGLYKWYLNDNI